MDDEDGVRQALRSQLKETHVIEEAATGEEALAFLENNRPDLVILDITLPTLSGWDVCKRLKDDPATKTIPILMLTGSASQAKEGHGWVSGVADYLHKPWDRDFMLQTVQHLLDTKKS